MSKSSRQQMRLTLSQVTNSGTKTHAE